MATTAPQYSLYADRWVPMDLKSWPQDEKSLGIEESSGARVVIGVDGGATSTSCAVLPVSLPNSGLGAERISCETLGCGKAGSSNRNSVGDEAACLALRDAIASALAAAKVSRRAVVAVAACMAGVDRPADIQLVTSWLRMWFPEPVHLIVQNDAIAALASGTLGHIPGLTPVSQSPDSLSSQAHGEGAIVIIAGTGTIVLGVNKDGNVARASGAGPLLGDRGSGYAIASEGLGAVMRAADGRGPQTSLTSAILQHLGLQEASDLIGWIYKDLAWARVAALLPVVKCCAADGDAEALRILDDAAQELVCGVKAVVTRLGLSGPRAGPSFDVIAAGGVLEDSTVYDLFCILKERLAMEIPQAMLKRPQVDAEVGAALLACRTVA